MNRSCLQTSLAYWQWSPCKNYIKTCAGDWDVCLHWPRQRRPRAGRLHCRAQQHKMEGKSGERQHSKLQQTREIFKILSSWTELAIMRWGVNWHYTHNNKLINWQSVSSLFRWNCSKLRRVSWKDSPVRVERRNQEVWVLFPILSIIDWFFLREGVGRFESDFKTKLAWVCFLFSFCSCSQASLLILRWARRRSWWPCSSYSSPASSQRSCCHSRERPWWWEAGWGEGQKKRLYWGKGGLQGV